MLCALLTRAALPAAESRTSIPPAALVARAQQARQLADGRLAEARQRHLAERKALAAELQRAYADLDEAKRASRAAAESLRRQREATQDLERRAANTPRRIQSRLASAASAAQVALEPSGSIEAMESALWQGFQARLAGIEAGMRAALLSSRVCARDGQERDVQVLRLGDYAAYACGHTASTRGLLKGTREGKQMVVGPHLTHHGIDALRRAAAGVLTRLPIDAANVLHGRAPSEPKTIQTWLRAGRLFVYPIIAVGLAGLALLLERLVYLAWTKPPASLVADVLAQMEEGDLGRARESLRAARSPTVRVLRAAVDAAGLPSERREAAMETALLAEAPRLERSLTLMGALASVAPLLGLLGTVSGMIATFDAISATGASTPRLLSGGISEALITTQLGLMVAIPLLLAHAGLSRWVERREAQLEYCAIQAFGIEDRVEESS